MRSKKKRDHSPAGQEKLIDKKRGRGRVPKKEDPAGPEKTREVHTCQRARVFHC